MPFKSFDVGEVLTANDVNTYLMKQAVAVVTSGTRPSSPVEGQMIYETDTQSLVIYTGSVWETLVYHGDFLTYTPTWTASNTNPSIGDGDISGYYRRLPGRTVHLRITMNAGSTTNMGDGTYSLSLPTALPAEVGTRWFGIGMLSESGGEASVYHLIPLILAGSTGDVIDRLRFDDQGADGIENWSSSRHPFGSSDWFVQLQLMYETTYLESS